MNIINISDVPNNNWRWIEPSLENNGSNWVFYNSKPKNWFERLIKKPSLARIRTVFQALFVAKEGDLIVIHGPYLAFYYGIFSKLTNKKLTCIVYSFNFTSLPHGLSRTRMSYAFKIIDKFVAYSSMEKELYASWFNIPEDKIDICLWGVKKPGISKKALIDYPYITAIGGNSRDYRTLMEAMKDLPSINLVAVMRPSNLIGLDVPNNVEVRTNIDRLDANNILGFAKFMVLPLVGSEIPCGHVTLVAAMHLSVPSVVTNSTGLDDYVSNNNNAIIVDDNDVGKLTKAIELLWSNTELQNTLSINGLEFANKYCTEKVIINHFNEYLNSTKK